MGYTTVNFADVDSFEPLPEGQYDIEIDKVEVRENKAGDGLYLNWELVVLDGDYENRRLWMITSLKETALFRLKTVLEELDVLEDDEIELEYDDDVKPTPSAGPRLLYPELDGLEAIAVVKNEMYDGRERNRVNELLGANTRAKAKSSKATAKRSRNGGGDDEEEPKARSSRRSSSRSSSGGGSRRRVR